MAALAFFYLAFLGVEYLFDEKVALLAGAGSVAMAESVVVGISVAGFLLYPPALRFSERRIKPLLLVAGGLAAACSVEIGVAEQPVAVYVAGAVGLLCLGFVGAAAHDAVAREREDAGIASTVGVAYTAAILLQVELQELTEAGLMRAALLAAACLASAAPAAARAAVPKALETAASGDVPATRALPILAAIVAPMTRIFSTLNVTLTGMHAAGQVASAPGRGSSAPALALVTRANSLAISAVVLVVLAALTTSDSSMQDLARQLFMSRTALYRHISSMCGRVGVDNRQALLLCYFSWRPEDLG